MASTDLVRQDATVARTDKPLSTTNPPRRTIYVDYTTSDAPPTGGSRPPSGGKSMLRPTNVSGTNRADASRWGLPAFFGGRRIIFGSWIVAIAVVSWDEWTVNGVLPRPARLWWTSVTFGLLMLLSLADLLLPLANALAIGFVIALLWQYFNKEGQFAQSGGSQ